MNHAILLISCPDQKGITASVTGFVYQHNGNIIDADQHIDEQSNTFFMRLEWSLAEFSLSKENLKEAFRPLAERFGMQWEISFSEKIERVAIFVSKPLHCLYDLLIRQKAGQLNCEFPLIISNHSDAGAVAEDFAIKFVEIPITPKNKSIEEKRQLKLLQEFKVDLVVLARYQQILSPYFVGALPAKIINIHHSFLPAFPGSQPYAQAYRKGVKVIGATSHFVTEKLDEGPIIEQDTVRVSHRDSLEDLIRKGEDLEKVVLNRALRWALEKKILCYDNKTVVFA